VCTPRTLSIACLLLAGAVPPGCDSSRDVRVVSAEFRDETPDGAALQRESFRLSLSRPLPPGFLLSNVKVQVSPPVQWTYEVLPGANPHELLVRISTGRPAFRFQGVHGVDADASGIGIDLGNGVLAWTDLSIAVSLPVLERAIWEDRYPPEGNFAVDQGDVIRLVFDRPVKLTAEGEDLRILVPQDILLTKQNSDRLDNGEFPAHLEPSSGEREVLLVLGSRPFLSVAGELPQAAKDIERFDASAPSGLALNGTELLPFPKIVDARGGPGSISIREVDVEFPPGFRFAEPRAGQELPPPSSRTFHTLTPIASGRAIVAGGAAADTHAPTDQVLVYDPLAAEEDPSRAFLAASRPLPHPTQSHTATMLAGPDEAFGTFDDFVVLAGGTDGARSLDDITILLPREDGRVDVEPLAQGLRVARAEHAATAVGPNELLVDGGRKSDPNGPGGLVQCAELIVFEHTDLGRPRIAHHRVFRTLARSLHTLTLLPPTSSGEVYALAVGGFGAARHQLSSIPDLGKDTDDKNAFCSTDKAAVLAAPLLLNVSRPERSFELRMEFLYPLVRWGHVALPIETERPADAPPRSNVVLIAGGAVRHPLRGLEKNRDLWERNEREKDRFELPPRYPQEHEAAAVVLFRFDPTSIADSRFEVLPHATPDPGRTPDRVYFAATPVWDRGIVLSGGELRDGAGLTSLELYIADEQRVCELAAPLAAPRTRHQAYAVRRGDRTSIVLIGGIPGAGHTGAFRAVEEAPIR